MTEDRPLDDQLLANLSDTNGEPTTAKYTPTEREIHVAKNKIQAEWTDVERQARTVTHVEPTTIPEASPRKAFIKRRGGLHGGGV